LIGTWGPSINDHVTQALARHDSDSDADTLEMPGPDAEEAPMRGIKRRRVIVIDDELAGAATKDAEDAEDAMKDADVEEEANKDKRHKKDVKKTT